MPTATDATFTHAYYFRMGGATESARQFLIVRLSSIGDIVHALPAAAALAESFPEARVDWVVEKRFALLLEGNPHLARVLTLDTLGWRKNLGSLSTWREVAGGIGALRQRKYTAAVDLQGLWKSAVVSWLSGAPERVGLARAWLREPSAGVLYTQRVSPTERVHVVRENLALVERLGARPSRWQFPLPHNAEDDAYVAAQLGQLDSERFIIVNPGGGWRSKCWSPENYVDLVRQLGESGRHQTILTGSSAEEPLIEDILKGAATKAARYVPTTLVQFIALARRAGLFVGGDTGPLHLAAAVGTPIVGIYGPTDPIRNGPFAPADIALSNREPTNHTRRGTNPAYLAGISVRSVLAAVEERLARVHG